jgi:hypothetical protein
VKTGKRIIKNEIERVQSKFQPLKKEQIQMKKPVKYFDVPELIMAPNFCFGIHEHKFEGQRYLCLLHIEGE